MISLATLNKRFVIFPKTTRSVPHLNDIWEHACTALFNSRWEGSIFVIYFLPLAVWAYIEEILYLDWVNTTPSYWI